MCVWTLYYYTYIKIRLCVCVCVRVKMIHVSDSWVCLYMYVDVYKPTGDLKNVQLFSRQTGYRISQHLSRHYIIHGDCRYTIVRIVSFNTILSISIIFAARSLQFEQITCSSSRRQTPLTKPPFFNSVLYYCIVHNEQDPLNFSFYGFDDSNTFIVAAVPSNFLHLTGVFGIFIQFLFITRLHNAECTYCRFQQKLNAHAAVYFQRINVRNI